jgi:predicted transcriptional regulator
MSQEYVNTQTQQQQAPKAASIQVSRRSRMETFCDILKAIGAGAEKPTHIMYKANLSWTVMQSYMRSLEAQGLVIPTTEDEKKTYHLSDKGFQLLNQFVSIREDLNLQSES